MFAIYNKLKAIQTFQNHGRHRVARKPGADFSTWRKARIQAGLREVDRSGESFRAGVKQQNRQRGREKVCKRFHKSAA